MGLTKVTYSMIEGAPVNVKDFGAVGDGVTDDTAAIQAALNSGAGSVYAPSATYKITSTLYIPEYVIFHGDCRNTIILASSVVGAAIHNYSGTWSANAYKYGQWLNGMTITGTCDYGVVWMAGLVGGIKDVTIAATCSQGFVVDGSFGNKFENLNTGGATISGACFWAARDFNANHLDGLYTSNYSAYNFLSDVFCGATDITSISGYTSVSGNTGQGTTLTNVCCQGGVVGMALHSVNPGGWTINSPYFENCVKPIQLGNGSYVCRSVTLNSPLIIDVATANPGGSSTVAVDIDNAINVVINGIDFGGFGSGTDLVQYRLSHKVIINGFYLTTGGLGSKITDKIKHKTGADTDGGVMVLGEETSAAGSYLSHFLLMKSQGYSYQHYKMELNGSGAWSATSIVP